MITRILPIIALIVTVNAQTITTRTVDTGSGAATGQNISHAIIGGCPAVSYSETKIAAFSSNNSRSVLFARNSAADGTGAWITSTVFRGHHYGTAGLSSSLLEIEGKPSVIYHGDYGLWLAKNSTTDGSGDWTYTRISTLGTAGLLDSAILDGNPAVAFSDGNVLHLARCTSPSGTAAWQDFTIDTAENDIHGSISLAMVEGKPAIAYRADTGMVFMGDYNDFTHSQLRYARCATADGTGTWTITQVYEAPYQDDDACFQNSLAVIDGRPSVAFYYFGDLYYAHSGTVDGTGSWTTTAIETAGVTGSYPTLLSIAGFPAISYHKSTGVDLQLTRCDTADGSGTWTPVSVQTTGSVGTYAQMIVAEGNPAIAYFNATTRGVRWTRNSAADATGTWTDSLVDDGSDSGMVGGNAHLVVIDGNPAISYYDELSAALGRTKYARATEAGGLIGSWTNSLPSALLSSSYKVYPLGTRPAFAYHSSGARFLTNGLADGTGTWSSVLLDAAGTADFRSELTMIGGLPMTLYTVNPLHTLCLARNSMADGTGTWTSTTLTGMQTVGTPVLAEIAGNPAMSYLDASYNLVYRRCTTSDGTGAWTSSTMSPYATPTNIITLGGLPAVIFSRYPPNGQPHTILSVNSTVDGSGTWTETDLFTGYGDFAYVGGHPAFAMANSVSKKLHMLRSATTTFSGPWETWLIDGTTECASPSLATLSADTAGVAYYDVANTSLKYALLDFSSAAVSSLRMELDGAIVTPGQTMVNFGDTKIHATAATHALTLSNTGTADITISGVVLSGTGSPLFSQSGGPLTLAPGNSTTITLGYAPDSTSSAVHQATLDLTTSDPVLPAISFALTGRPIALDLLEAWRFTHFGTVLDEGDAASGANPDNDGFDNFFEFSTGTDPNRPNLYNTTLVLNNGNMEFTYTRNKEAVAYGVSFNVPWSETLISTDENWGWNYEDTVQTVISETATTETVKAVVPMGTAGRRFLRLEPW